jgi:hypothetical protein
MVSNSGTSSFLVVRLFPWGLLNHVAACEEDGCPSLLAVLHDADAVVPLPRY